MARCSRTQDIVTGASVKQSVEITAHSRCHYHRCLKQIVLLVLLVYLFVCFIFCPILLYIDDHEEARDGKMRLEGNGGYEHINSSCNIKPSAIEYATIKSRAPFTLSFFSQ